MASPPLIRINPQATIRREPITPDEFCVIVDDFLLEPDAVIEFAAEHRREFSHPNIGYPGMQIRINDGAMKDIFRFIRSKMSRQFRFMRGRIGIRTLLSMVTLPADSLSFMQRICHIDPRRGRLTLNLFFSAMPKPNQY